MKVRYTLRYAVLMKPPALGMSALTSKDTDWRDWERYGDWHARLPVEGEWVVLDGARFAVVGVVHFPELAPGQVEAEIELAIPASFNVEVLKEPWLQIG